MLKTRDVDPDNFTWHTVVMLITRDSDPDLFNRRYRIILSGGSGLFYPADLDHFIRWIRNIWIQIQLKCKKYVKKSKVNNNVF